MSKFFRDTNTGVHHQVADAEPEERSRCSAIQLVGEVFFVGKTRTWRFLCEEKMFR